MENTFIMENKYSLVWYEVGESYSVYCFEFKGVLPVERLIFTTNTSYISTFAIQENNVISVSVFKVLLMKLCFFFIQ